MFHQHVLVSGFIGETLVGVLQPSDKPIHLLDRKKFKPLNVDDYVVDLGLPVEAVHSRIEVGDMVTMDRSTELMGDCVVSKTLDDRLGVYVMIEATRAIGGTQAEIVAVASTQEEVGLRAAQTAAFEIEPDTVVALDVTIAADYTDGTPETEVSRLGNGAVIKIMDGSFLVHPLVLRHFRDVAEHNNINYLLDILPRGGTDAGAMQRSRGGAVAITLSIPTRYLHTVNEMANVADIDPCVDLLSGFLEEAGDRAYQRRQSSAS